MCCLTCYDIVRSFWGHGQKITYRLMMYKAEQFQDQAQLGNRPKL